MSTQALRLGRRRRPVAISRPGAAAWPIGERAGRAIEIFEPHDMVPAPGQGGPHVINPQPGGLDGAGPNGTMVIREQGEAGLAGGASLGRELAARMLALDAANLMSAKTDREDHD